MAESAGAPKGSEAPDATGPKRRRVPIELLVFAAVALIGFGVWRFVIFEPRKPNFILISIDSLRADHLGCYGYGKPTTPTIDALAARGTRFKTVHSSTTWTLPAHMSMMTGLPDDLHEVVQDTIRLPDNRATLAERFRNGGYRTAGVFGGPYLHKLWGFDRGFEEYKNCGVKTIADYDTSKMSQQELLALIAEIERQSHEVQTAEPTEKAAEQFLATAGDRPFFLFVHHWDVHYDYIAPDEFLAPFLTPEMERVDTSNFFFSEKIRADMPARQLAYVIARYDAEIRWVDAHVQRLLAQLDKLGLADNTYVIVTADHGEEFFEHGQKGHRNNLFEETLRVPLIVAGPGVSRGKAIDRGVRIVDVMPTLLDLAGLTPEPQARGVSLAPFLHGEDPPVLAELPFYAELTYVPLLPTAEPDTRFRKTQVFGRGCLELMTEEWRAYDPKKATDFSGEVIEREPDRLFDLCNDPLQHQDASTTHADDLERMRIVRNTVQAGMDKLRKLLATAANNAADVPAALRQALKQMGY